MGDWDTTTLHNKIHIKHGFPFKSEFFADDGDYIVLTPGNFYEEGGFKRQIGKEKFYTGTIPQAYLHKKGDLIVAMTEQAAGLLGSCAIVPEDNIYLHNQRLGLITANDEEVDKMFIYHLFKTKTVREQIRLTSTGSKVKHTAPERIYDVVVKLPPKPIQEKIAAVLSGIDKKIELNNRINAELEAMAKTLYDYWFVQFDFPDKNGKPYKSSGGRMVYNEILKREIPKDWGIVKLSDVLQNNSVSISADKISSIDPYTPIDSLPMKKMSYGDYEPSSEAKTSLIKYERNDILIGAMRVYFHRVCIAPFDGVTRTTTMVLRSKNEKHTPYLYQVCNEERLIAHATKISGGTQQPYVKWENSLSDYTFPYPKNMTLLDEYSDKIRSTVENVILRENESKKLKDLRDWLLPMLMNGQVKVK